MLKKILPIVLIFMMFVACNSENKLERESGNRIEPSKIESSKTTEVKMLPEDFKVYTYNNSITNQYFESAEERILPIYNYYKGSDGGYVAIYTRDKENAVYSVGGDIYVAGMVRVKGSYISRIFYPIGYKEGDNITQDKDILEICEKFLPKLKGKLWIGGDTGGFL